MLITLTLKIFVAEASQTDRIPAAVARGSDSKTKETQARKTRFLRICLRIFRNTASTSHGLS